MTSARVRKAARLAALLLVLLVLLARFEARSESSADGEGTGSASQIPITALAFTPRGELVVGRSTAGVEISSGTDALPRKLPCDLGRVEDIEVSPAGDLIAIAGGAPADEGGVELREIASGDLIAKALPHDDVAHAVAWSPDGALVATAGHDRLVALLDARTGEIRARLLGHSRPVLAVAFVDAKLLVSAGGDRSLRVWDVDRREAVRILDQHTDTVHALALRPALAKARPPFLASAAADGTVRFWQPAIGRLVRFARLPSPPLDLAWTDEGRFVVAACRDGVVRAIDPETVALTAEWHAVDGWAYAVALRPDGTVAAGGEGGKLATRKLTNEPQIDTDAAEAGE